MEKEPIEQKMNELFQEIKRAEPPDEIWDSIERKINAHPRSFRRWRTVAIAVAICFGIALLAGISQTPPVLAAIQNIATAIGGFGNPLHVKTVDGQKLIRQPPFDQGVESQRISLDQAKQVADFPLYVVPPESGSLVQISKVNFPRGVWLDFIFNTPYGPVWLNERKYANDDATLSTRESTLISGQYKGYFNNGFLVWKAQDTWISMTFLSRPQLNQGEEIKAHLKQLADELQVVLPDTSTHNVHK